MDNEIISALDDIESSDKESPISTTTFIPPALAGSQYKQLELLQHLSLYSELLIFISAEHGMGKTFIAKALLASRETPDQNLMIEADFALTYLDVLQKLAQFFDLGQGATDLENIENQVIAHCLKLAEEEQGSMLLVIDQADQLADETLEELNHLALLAPNAFHLMLLATPQFEERLVRLPEPQAPVHVMEVDVLTESEAEILLLQYFPEKEWTGEEVEYILHQGGGNPGKVLYIAQQLVAGKIPENPTKASTAKFPITHIAAMLLVACTLLVTYWYHSGTNEIQAVTEDVAGAITKIEPLTPAVTEHDSVMYDQAAMSLNASHSAASDDIEIAEAEKVIVDKDAESAIDFNFVSSDTKDPLTIQADLGTNDDAVAVENLAAKEIAAKKAITDKKVLASYTADEKVLLAADPTAFVIQLFASHSQKNAQVFVNTYASTDRVLLTYLTEHQGKPWHVVVAGPFDSRGVATKQAKALPAKLRKQNPWVRSIAPIQGLIKSEK